jgi:hypothetical protein
VQWWLHLQELILFWKERNEGSRVMATVYRGRKCRKIGTIFWKKELWLIHF